MLERAVVMYMLFCLIILKNMRSSKVLWLRIGIAKNCSANFRVKIHLNILIDNIEMLTEILQIKNTMSKNIS